MGLGLLEDLADGVARMLEFAGDLADGLAIAPGSPDRTVVVHRKHVLDPAEGESSAVGRFTLPEVVTVGRFYALRLPPDGSVLRFSRTFDGDGATPGRKNRESCQNGGFCVGLPPLIIKDAGE